MELLECYHFRSVKVLFSLGFANLANSAYFCSAACPRCAVVSYPPVPQPARSCLISPELPVTDPTEDDGN